MFLKFRLRMLPPAAECNPERHENQPDVEPEALLSGVQAVEPELTPPRHVAWRVNLGDAGEARPQKTPFGVTGDLVHWNQLAAGRRFDFAGAKGARSDEAHITAEDVPELRQLVHGGCSHQPADASDA